jgi:hypothetical protein
MIFVLSWSVCHWQTFPALSNKHSGLVRKYKNHGQKSFITLAPGWKGSPGTNAPACFSSSPVLKKKTFHDIETWGQYYKLFFFVAYAWAK